MLCSSI